MSVLAIIDNLLCSYLGLEREEVRPVSVRIIDQKLAVTNTTSHKRHAMTESWDDFTRSGVTQTDPEDRERLGIAAGQAIARNLVVSFEEPRVQVQRKK